MTIKVKLNTSNLGIVPGTQTIVIKNQASTISTGRIDTLQDVVEQGVPAEGSTLVYNPTTDKYEVQKLNFTDVDGPLDGGSF